MKDKNLTWEEIIQFIRTEPEYKELVIKAYFEENLPSNIERFRNSIEFKKTLEIIKKYQPNAKKILDIGSGNGVSAISFALEGFEVTSVEPDPSFTIGAGAIRQLKEFYHLDTIEIFEAFAEEIKFTSNSFDVVYARQCMHHAYDLQSFVNEARRVLKKDGLFLTVRDHVIFNPKDRALFLECHPLHKYYGGENAFSPNQYKKAMKNAKLKIIKELKHFDSEINYYPETKEDVNKRKNDFFNKIPFSYLLKNMPKLKEIILVKFLAYKEKQIPGRMYSYIAQKK